jgi:hypothetical protein
MAKGFAYLYVDDFAGHGDRLDGCTMYRGGEASLCEECKTRANFLRSGDLTTLGSCKNGRHQYLDARNTQGDR